ncbi:MAG: sodium/solute symporter [Rickettsiales bacterium]|nr:sodium/solute symporter [Rickettsiales bacterium]
MPTFELGTLDYAIICGYFLVVLFIGWWYGRNHETAESYFLAGRSLPWWLIGFSLYASNMSGASFVGLMGATYEHGIAVFHYEWTAVVALVFFAAFMLPYFLKAKIATIPEFLEKRFDARSRKAYSAFTIIAITFIDTAGALYAGGLVINLLIPSISLLQAVMVLGFVVGIYTLYGGLESVVVADAFQAVLLVIGASIVCWLGLEKIGGWDAMMAALPESKTQLFKPADDDFMPWPGIFGVVLLGFYYWTLNQFIAQRALGAKNLDEGRKGALFAGLLKLPNLFLMIVPGLVALALYPDLERPDMAFPALTVDLLPTGLRGLVLTALVAAIMSSLSSTLNAAATLVTYDFIVEHKPDIPDHRLVAFGRILTGVFMLIGIFTVPMIVEFGSLFEYFQKSLAYIVPGVVGIYFVGLFSRWVTASAAFWSLALTLTMGVAILLLREYFGIWQALGLPDIHFTIMAIIVFVNSIVTCYLFTPLTNRADDASDTNYCYSLKGAREIAAENPQPKGLANSTTQSYLLLALMIAMLVWLA